MAQFCTHCGKPLSPGIRFCPACGNAVASPTIPPPSQPVSSTPSQAPQFMPVTRIRGISAIPPSVPATSVSNKWTDVAAPIAPETAPPSSQFAPVDVSAAPPASTSTPSQGWARRRYPHRSPDRTSVLAVRTCGCFCDSASQHFHAQSRLGRRCAGQRPRVEWFGQLHHRGTAGSHLIRRRASTSHFRSAMVPRHHRPHTAPPASSASQQWSQTTPPASSAGQQWTQTPNTSFPAPAPVSGVGQPRQRSILPKLIGIALVLILLVGVVVVGGVVYVGYKVRQKTRGVTQNLSRLANEQGLDLTKGGSPDAKGTLQSLFGALSGKTASNDGIPVFSSSDPVTPCTASVFRCTRHCKGSFQAGNHLHHRMGR